MPIDTAVADAEAPAAFIEKRGRLEPRTAAPAFVGRVIAEQVDPGEHRQPGSDAFLPGRIDVDEIVQAEVDRRNDAHARKLGFQTALDVLDDVPTDAPR